MDNDIGATSEVSEEWGVIIGEFGGGETKAGGVDGECCFLDVLGRFFLGWTKRSCRSDRPFVEWIDVDLPSRESSKDEVFPFGGEMLAGVKVGGDDVFRTVTVDDEDVMSDISLNANDAYF